MKRWLILAALVIGISASASLAVYYLPTVSSSTDVVHFPVPPKPTGPVPKIVVEGEPKYEFGAKAQHVSFAKDWVVWNKGEADLRLAKQSTSCSCTAANFENGVSEITVKPNESTTIHLTFNTKEFSGDYYQRATISTTDPAQPSIELGAHGEVHPALIFTPPDKTIAFMTIPNDTDHRTKIAVSSPDKPGFKITKAVSSKPDLIEATVTSLTDEDRKQLKIKEGGYQVTVTVKHGMPLGPFRDELLLETDHPKQPESRLVVFGKVVGPVTLVPEHLSLPNVSAKAGGKGTVTLMVRGLRPTKFEVVKKPDAIEASVEPVDPAGKDGKYRLTVTVPPGTTPTTIDDIIVLKTDHPQAEVVKVPVTLYIGN
ncbi:MAG: DUF1573 domain-containing protein [Isosphaeraceae bacterium]|nr:DUF1573 domain-containing protein [Isosphaeraceae bacterium]